MVVGDKGDDVLVADELGSVDFSAPATEVRQAVQVARLVDDEHGRSERKPGDDARVIISYY